MDETALQQQLAELPGWAYVGGMLQKTFKFKTFIDAIGWTVRVGFVAEARGHHPDIDIRYNRVTLALVTHDAGNMVTDKDIDLAKGIEALA